MPESNNLDAMRFVLNPVDDPIRSTNELAQVGLTELWHHPSSLGKLRQTLPANNRLVTNASGRQRRR